MISGFGQNIKFERQKYGGGSVFVYEEVISKIYQDTILYVDDGIPDRKQREAYRKGISYFDTTKSSFYCAENFWLMRYSVLSYQFAQYDKKEKTIDKKSAEPVYGDKHFAWELLAILVAAILVTLMVFFLGHNNYTKEQKEKSWIFAIGSLLPSALYLVALILSSRFGLHYCSRGAVSLVFVGGFALLVFYFFCLPFLTILLKREDLERSDMILQKINLAISLLAILLVTGSFFALALAVVICLAAYYLTLLIWKKQKDRIV